MYIPRQLAYAVILDPAADHDADVEKLMTLKEDVAFSWKEPFRNPEGVKGGAEAENGAHQQQPTHAASLWSKTRTS